MGERVRFKSTLDFVYLMDQYIELMPEFVLFQPIMCTKGLG